MTTRSKKDVRQELFGVQTFEEADEICRKRFQEYTPPDLSLWVKIQLPYKAPNHPDIPSVDEIEQELRVRNLKGQGFRNVCRIGKYFVKSSRGREVLQEGEDMLFLRENSQVRVPTVYAIFRHNETNYLVMEFLEGGELSEKRWFALDDDARTKILSRLCEQYRLLRSIPPPSPEYYGRVHHQGWGPLSQIFIHRTDRMVGPFDSIRDFLSETVYSMLVTAVTGSLLPEFTCNELEHIAHYESTLATCSGTKPIFTHSDPSLHNIIARPIRDGQDWEVTLIDWAWCGWYPAYMQTVFLHAYIGLRRPINEIVEESDDKVMTKIQQFYASIGELDVEATDHFLGTIERSFEESYSEQLKLIKEMPIGTQPLLM